MTEVDMIQPFFGALGCTAAMSLTCFGGAYWTAKSGIGIMASGVLRPNDITKSTSRPRMASVELTNCCRLDAVVLAGILAIYGLVMSVLIAGKLQMYMSLFQSFVHVPAFVLDCPGLRPASP